MRVSDGLLIIESRIPIQGNLKERGENESVWVPQILITKPQGTPILIDGTIRLENVPMYFTKKSGGIDIWQSSREIARAMNTVGYLFLPGELNEDYRKSVENNSMRKLQTITEGFSPDIEDQDNTPLEVNILSYPANFLYTIGHHENIKNISENNLGPTLLRMLSIPKRVGYNCSLKVSKGQQKVTQAASLEGYTSLSSKEAKEVSTSIYLDYMSRLYPESKN